MNKLICGLLISSTVVPLFVTSVFAQKANVPILKVITPAEGQTIYGGRIPILLSTENFGLTDYEKNPILKYGQGHIHLWMDDATPTAESAKKLVEDHFTYSEVFYGDHTLQAELVNNNHTPLYPPIVVNIKFKNVPISSPAPVVTSGFDKNTALVILVVVALVIVAAWWYTKEEDEMPSTKSEKTTSTTIKSIKKRKK